MDRLMGNRPINWNALFSFSNLEKDVQKHLKNVYATLAMGLIAAAAGAYVHLFYFLQAGLLTGLLSIGCLMAVYLIPHRRENITLRMLCFLGAAFLMGISLGPLMGAVKAINPSIIPTAFLGTAIIFVCFSLNALWAKQRSYLYLGGILMSVLSLLCVSSLVNIFMRSETLFTAELYLGFGVFCVMVLFDTQLMVEKRRMGDDDFIWHALDLFIDAIEIFRHLTVILARRERRNRDD